MSLSAVESSDSVWFVPQSIRSGDLKSGGGCLAAAVEACAISGLSPILETGVAKS